MSRSFPGNTLCWPPKVSSPNGRPRIIKIDKMMTIPKEIAPTITNGSILVPPHEDTLLDHAFINKKLEVATLTNYILIAYFLHFLCN